MFARPSSFVDPQSMPPFVANLLPTQHCWSVAGVPNGPIKPDAGVHHGPIRRPTYMAVGPRSTVTVAGEPRC